MQTDAPFDLEKAIKDAGWQPIQTAPKGYPAIEQESEWFLARGGQEGPKYTRFAVIRRTFHNGFGPWQGTGDEQYKADFFTEWRPIGHDGNDPLVSLCESQEAEIGALREVADKASRLNGVCTLKGLAGRMQGDLILALNAYRRDFRTLTGGDHAE